jgi:hypothetical protein
MSYCALYNAQWRIHSYFIHNLFYHKIYEFYACDTGGAKENPELLILPFKISNLSTVIKGYLSIAFQNQEFIHWEW